MSYLSAHKKSLLLAAQRQDLNSKSETIKTLFLNITQVLALILFKNYYVYIIFLPLSTILEYFLITIITRKKFSNICNNRNKINVDGETKNEIKTNTFALIFHKIGGTLVYSTDNILISSLLGLTVLGVYSNYYLIIGSLIALINVILNALKGSIGNLIAKEKSETIRATFEKMNFVYMWFVGLCTICLGCLFQPFIKLWIGENFIFSNLTMFLLVLSFFLNVSKFMIYSYKECSGLLSQDKYRPIYEVIINLVVSIVLGKVIGINGIIIGTITCTVLGPLITEPYVVYKHLFKENVCKYYLKYIINLLVTTLIFAISFWLCNFINGYGIWQIMLKFIISVASFNILYLIITFWTKDFKDSFKWALNKITKIKGE